MSIAEIERGSGQFMPGVTIEVDASQYAAAQALLTQFPIEAPKAISRAINRALDTARTIAKRVIARELGIKQSDLVTPHAFGRSRGKSTGEALHAVGASASRLIGALLISGRRIPLIWFHAKQLAGRRITRTHTTRSGNQTAPYRMKTRSGGVIYRIGTGGRKKVVPAFTGRGRKGGWNKRAGKSLGVAEVGTSGHVGVFVRAFGAKRLPLVQLHGPSIPLVARHNAELSRGLRIDVTDTLRKRLAHEFERILAKRTKGHG